MFFRLESPVINSQKYNIWVLQGARLSIDLYKITPAHKPLSDYLWKTYGLSLKAACMVVLANCKFQKNKNNELFVLFNSKKIDKLASIITYGTGKIQGCSILKEAFCRDCV